MKSGILFFFLLLVLSSCFVSREDFSALQEEIHMLKSGMADADKDGIPDYRDQEANTDPETFADVKGREIKEVKIVDRDEDGVLDEGDFCPTMKGSASANGCPDKDGDGFYDFLDKCPDAPGIDSLAGCPIPKPPVAEAKLIENKKVSINYGIRFIDKTTKYRPKTKTILDTLIYQASETLLKNPKYKIEIQSYTDSIGDTLQNKALCQNRAENVKKLLLKKGVEESRVLIRAFGAQNPDYSNDTKEGREANNRIKLNVIKEE